MAILIDEHTEAIIQGITGQAGRRTAHVMKAYGTRVRGGVTPGKGGQEVEGLPVFDTVAEAKAAFPRLSASVVAVPRRLAKGAVFEAIEAGIRILTLPTERVPRHDMLEIIEFSRMHGSLVLGGNSGGAISPGKCTLGGIGGRVEFTRLAFRPGPCGVMSRSGGQLTTVCYYLSRAGVGVSTGVAVGGDAFVGTTWCDLMERFEADPETRLVVAFGEIGTTTEEDAARMIQEKRFTKPLIVYVAGRYARPDVRFGHAGAIITRGTGDAATKQRLLREAGAVVVEHLADIGQMAREALAGLGA